MRFKRCAMVPNSRHLADFDDDTLAKTWLHDVKYNSDEVFGKDTQSFIGMPLSVSGQSLRA
jgi:hypothetical protein